MPEAAYLQVRSVSPTSRAGVLLSFTFLYDTTYTVGLGKITASLHEQVLLYSISLDAGWDARADTG